MTFPIFDILLYSLTIMFATEMFKPFISKKYIVFISAIISCIGAFAMEINIFLVVGFKLNHYGYIFSTFLTGVVLSRGSNFLHYLEHQLRDLVPAIQNIKQLMSKLDENSSNNKSNS